jgi:hypothetical protein
LVFGEAADFFDDTVGTADDDGVVDDDDGDDPAKADVALDAPGGAASAITRVTNS